MRKLIAMAMAGVVLGVVTGPTARAELKPGQVLDQSNAADAKDLLPPEIHAFYQNGDYSNVIVDFPNTKWDWDDEFKTGTKWNAEHLVLDAGKSPIDKATGKRPDYMIGLPFPKLDEKDPDVGTKILWNLDFAYYAGGNSHNWTALNWISRSGVDRSSVQDVYFLYYEGQPRAYSPPTNPQEMLFQLLAASKTPADLQGTASISYRFKDPGKRDLSWAYVPALRRVRAISPANRSDGFLGSDQSQDDGFFFDGKVEDFSWKYVGHKDGYRICDPDSVAGKVKRKALPGGGWRTDAFNNDHTVGFQEKDWKGVAWAPVRGALCKRSFWIIEGAPKDKYYLYGRIELWIDDQSWQGAWNRKFSWRGELLNVLQVMGYATAPFNEKERWWGSTMAYQGSLNVKADRATVTGQHGPGEDPADDRRIPIKEDVFDYQTLSRVGK